MRKSIYERIKAALLASGEIKHVAPWNRNVEFVDTDEPWERPAVFIEFKAIKWAQTKEPSQRGTGQIHLHIVTDWTSDDTCTDAFDMAGKVDDIVEAINGRGCSRFALEESHTCHDHEELLESIEVFGFRCERRRIK